MRLFKSKKHNDKGNASRPDTPSGGESEARRHDELEGGESSTAIQQQQQPPPQHQERPQKPGRGMQAMMNRQPRQLSDQDLVQESIGLSQPTQDSEALVEIHTWLTPGVMQIGRFCGLNEDWSIVLELTDNLKTSTASCKLAAEYANYFTSRAHTSGPQLTDLL